MGLLTEIDVLRKIHDNTMYTTVDKTRREEILYSLSNYKIQEITDILARLLNRGYIKLDKINTTSWYSLTDSGKKYLKSDADDDGARAAKYKSEVEAKEQLVDSHVNPAHYKDNIYGAEVWEQMVKLFGEVEYLSFCKLNAYKYRMRAGTKSGALAEVDIAKAIWYETKYKEIKDERPF
tara:strand:- start:4683 stop:5219 length:537 start_codon:yes stop_codon:yes gene_type:complete